MKKRVFLLTAMMALLTFSVFGQNGKKFFKAGNDLFESQKYEDAVAQFTSALGLEPSNADYYSARAKAYEVLNKFNEAYADYEKSIVFKPKEVDALISLGRVCNKLNKFDQALVLLNHASALDKRNSQIYPEKMITLIGLERYDQALKASDTAVLIKDDPKNYYYRGLIYVKLNNDILGKKELEKAISKSKGMVEPRLELAELLIRNGNTQEAMNQINVVLSANDKNVAAYIARSEIYKKNLDFPSAINDISKVILIEPANPEYYLIRGLYYQEFSQHTNAINDISKYISLKADNPDAFYSRAKSYEEIMNFEKAMEDYNKIAVLSEDDPKARKLLRIAKDRLYELNRETIAPEISVVSPVPVKDTIEIRGDKAAILITGKIKDKSAIKSFSINNGPVTIAPKNGEYEFLSNIDVTGIDKITLIARDDYDNEKVVNFTLARSEINPPVISLVAPYTSDDGQVFLESSTPNIAIQGKITDESQIKSITVGDVTASYNRKEMNPAFTAILDVANLNKFSVVVEDIYGNRQETEYKLNREGAQIAANNPMGKTWVVFIENSSYEKFASLDGPIRDVSTIRRALANYQIHNIIHKKDMTKAEMEKYFNIELRDLVKKNQVKSILVWYAGHGKFINDVGYWIPVDAIRDEEFTYFNINALKAGLQGYADVVHTLVVSDACESGPGFYTAMRSAADAPTCDNTIVTGAKSAQVFSSAGYELAVDNSKFTATFANTLMNNTNACIPIETIVKSVTAAVATESGQKPKFGKIQGLEDMNGTFFFIAK
jgi:tetratricopeptide (TPR) repeat protein